MRIHSIQLHQFRNYDNISIPFFDSIILFCGNNGQGKTNLLEALYVCGMGKSYRDGTDADLIQWNCQKGSIIVEFERNRIQQSIKVILSKGTKKELWVNKTKVSQRELLGTLNEVLFAPEDLQLIKGSPSLRRRFLDMEISQISPGYYRELLLYNRAVMQRNLLLKKMRYENGISVEEWDRQIASFAASIVKRRLQALHKMSILSGIIHKRLSNEEEKLAVSYRQPYYQQTVHTADNMVDAAWYYKLLKDRMEEDIYRASTSIGPHRDDLCFQINGADVKKYGSQGQQRTAVLSLKLSELEFIKSEVGEYPILLLDDVMSELDETRRQALLRYVRGRIQTFITTTDPFLFSSMADCSRLCISQGKVVDKYDARKKE